MSSSLTPQDAALANATPSMANTRYTEVFGGCPYHDRPRPSSGIQNMLCINHITHPYGPISPGQPGLLFVSPGTAQYEDDYPSFRLFVRTTPPVTPYRDRRYRYLGDYVKVPMIRTQVEVDEWLSLPIAVSTPSSSLFHPLSFITRTKIKGVTSFFVLFFLQGHNLSLFSLSSSAVVLGRSVSTPRRRAMCVPSMPESVSERGVRMDPHPRRMRLMIG
jgi:hypothetical protein